MALLEQDTLGLVVWVIMQFIKVFCFLGSLVRGEHAWGSFWCSWRDPAHWCNPPRWWPDHSHSSQSALCLSAHSWAQASWARVPGGDSGMQGVHAWKPWFPLCLTYLSKLYNLTSFHPSTVPRVSCWWNLWCTEQEAWACIWGVAGYGNTYVCGQSLPACQRVIWWVKHKDLFVVFSLQRIVTKPKLSSLHRFHSWPSLQHIRPGFPTVRVWPLADPAWRPHGS